MIIFCSLYNESLIKDGSEATYSVIKVNKRNFSVDTFLIRNSIALKIVCITYLNEIFHKNFNTNLTKKVKK